MKTKKIVSLLLSMAVMLTSLSLLCIGASAVEVQNQIDIPDCENESEKEFGAYTYELDGVEYIVIRSAAEMNAVAAANKDGGNNYILDADLDYSGKTFERIALHNGSFNGNGHSITGVTLTLNSGNQSKHGIGMFATTIKEDNSGATGSTLKILNLTVGAKDNEVVLRVDNTYAPYGGGEDRIGTLLGYFQGTATIIENVTVYSNVSAPDNFRAGGLIGEARGTLVTINNCMFNGAVTVGTTVGTGKAAAGGFIGHSWSMSKVNISNSCVYGSIVCVGGGAGGLHGEPRQTTNIKNCANYAAVTGATSGGIVGDAGVEQKCDLTMENCFNAGSITGSTYAGGLAGALAYSTTYYAKLSNCANIGTVNNTTSDLYGKVTDTTALTVTECNAYGTFENDTDAAAALTFMQTNCSYAMFGIEDNKIVVKTVPAEAKFLQYKKDANANTMDVRVLGVINASDLSKYANVGFNVSVYEDGNDTPIAVLDPQTTTVVYKSVNANEGGTIKSYTAEALGATYLYALELQGIPMSGSYVFKITAFATEAEGGATVSDSVVTVTVVDGKIQ
ncbi:MAG: hypothetical protein IJZ80_01220 [Clostridia bacterium]|nr:hypothetical protein [Clostridia bacterium]